MLTDDVTKVLCWQRVWGVTWTKMKVENGHFGRW